MLHEHFEELVRQLTAVSFFALLLLWFSLLSSRSTQYCLITYYLPATGRTPYPNFICGAVPRGAQNH